MNRKHQQEALGLLTIFAVALSVAFAGLSSCGQEAECIDCVDQPCAEGESRCNGAVIETCADGVWVAGEDCGVDDEVCRIEEVSGEAACVGLSWTHLPVEIVDPIMSGVSLMMPADNPTFGYDAGNDWFVTMYDRDIFTPEIAFLWHLDGATGEHYKTELGGDAFAVDEGFCVGAESWCQFISFDPLAEEWVVVGPSTSVMMRVDIESVGSLTAVTGSHPSDSWINHTHRFDWSERRLLLYGATGPRGFGHTLYAFDLDAAAWSAAVTGLPQVDDNCLAYVAGPGDLYSIGGRETDDGGDTTQTLSTYSVIHVESGSVTTTELPAGIDARRAMSCAYDPNRNLIYVFGGSVINDRWNEILNEYHNDLWVLDPSDGGWTRLMPDTEPGTFAEPDDYGDRQFVGDPAKPNFGQHRGLMMVDTDHDRLIIMGEVPIFTHVQVYFMDLAGVEGLISP